MGDVRNNIIVMNRGDTFTFDLTIYDDNEEDNRYKLKENDALYFGIMDPHQPFEFALVRKKYTVADTDAAGNLVICIDPEDTIDLVPGIYYYMVKVHLDHEYIDPATKQPTGERIDEVSTVINKTKLILND